MKRLFFPLVALLTFSIVSSGQVVQDYLFSSEIEEKVQKHLADGKNLWNLQNLAVQFSFIGAYNQSLRTHKTFQEKNRGRTNPVEGPKPDLAYFDTLKPTSAVKTIAREAQNYRVVITNEAHYQPQNRVFTASLLKALYEKGFRYFSAEDLAVNDDVFSKREDINLNSRGYAIHKTGYYVTEPQYANLIRSALKLGYKIVTYEHYGSDQKDPLKRFVARENGQAKNIADVLERDPTAKIFILSGYGHLNERAGKDGVGLMGAMIKKNHDIDPLTIDQTSYLPETNHPYSNRISIKKPSVFFDKKHQIFSPRDAIIKSDIKVIFPKTIYRNGRPNWLFYEEGRKYYFPNLTKLKLKYPVLLMAYVQGEEIVKAIPADVIEIKTPNERKALVLKKGNYNLVVKTKNGRKISVQTFRVK